MRRAASILAVAGLLLGLAGSWVLLTRSLALAGDAAGAQDLCSAVFGTGCDETLADPSSRLLGIPLAGWGVLYFGAAVLLLLLGSLLDEAFRRGTRGLVGVFLLAGSVASLALLWKLASGGVALCPLCIVVNALNLLVFVLYTWGRAERRAEWSALASSLRYAAGGKAGDPVAARWRVVGLVFVLLAVLVGYQRILIEVREREASADAVTPEKILRDFLTRPSEDLGLDRDTVFVGGEDARLDLVVFGDVSCPHCRTFWKGARDLVARHGDALRIAYKHLPLDKSCNLGVAATFHPGTCEAAYALEAARLQGQFWPYYEALTAGAAGEPLPDLADAAIEAGLDPARFGEDLRRETTRERVDRDIALGRRLGFEGIPLYFLDGRRVPDPPHVALPILLDHLLQPAIGR